MTAKFRALKPLIVIPKPDKPERIAEELSEAEKSQNAEP